MKTALFVDGSCDWVVVTYTVSYGVPLKTVLIQEHKKYIWFSSIQLTLRSNVRDRPRMTSLNFEQFLTPPSPSYMDDPV